MQKLSLIVYQIIRPEALNRPEMRGFGFSIAGNVCSHNLTLNIFLKQNFKIKLKYIFRLMLIGMVIQVGECFKSKLICNLNN